MVSVPVAVYSLQMTTFIHQSQLRSTLGILSSTSFQCYLSLLRPSAILLLGKRNGVSIVNIPPGSQRVAPLVQLRHAARPVRKFIRPPLFSVFLGAAWTQQAQKQKVVK